MSSIQRLDEPLTPGQTPSAQEIQQKLSATQRKGKTRVPIPAQSGTDTEDELAQSAEGNIHSQMSQMSQTTSQPLSAIAEHTLSGPEESEEEADDVAGGWRLGKSGDHPNSNANADTTLTVLHSGYLWKKGAGRRKTWKKRWFVLRSTHLACYKTSAEYKLLRLLDVADIHAATPVQLKRHPNTCGIVTQARTFYFQAETAAEIDQWVYKINAAKDALQGKRNVPPTPGVEPPTPSENIPANTSTVSPSRSPISISIVVPPVQQASPQVAFAEPSSPISAVSPSRAHASNTSSDSEPDDVMSNSHGNAPGKSSSNVKDKDNKDLNKPILSGYLMKCGSHRKIWRKRWFVLTSGKIIYSGSHMDVKPHRQIPLTQILDAMEYRPAPSTQGYRHGSPNRHHEGTASAMSPARDNLLAQHAAPHAHAQQASNSSQQAEIYQGSAVNYTFKIITTKRTLVLCAPSEEEEIKWISAVRALIARRTKEKEAEAVSSGIKEAGAPSTTGAGNQASTTTKAEKYEKKKGIGKDASIASTATAGTIGTAGATTTSSATTAAIA